MVLKALAVAGVAAGAIYFGLKFLSNRSGDFILPGQNRVGSNELQERVTRLPTVRTEFVPENPDLFVPRDEWQIKAFQSALSLVNIWRARGRQQGMIWFEGPFPLQAQTVFGRPRFMPPFIHWRDSFETSRQFIYIRMNPRFDHSEFTRTQRRTFRMENELLGSSPYMFWVDQQNGFAVVDFWFGDFNGFWTLDQQGTLAEGTRFSSWGYNPT